MNKCIMCKKEIIKEETNPNLTDEERQKITKCCRCAVLSTFAFLK